MSPSSSSQKNSHHSTKIFIYVWGRKKNKRTTLVRDVGVRLIKNSHNSPSSIHTSPFINCENKLSSWAQVESGSSSWAIHNFFGDFLMHHRYYHEDMYIIWTSHKPVPVYCFFFFVKLAHIFFVWQLSHIKNSPHQSIHLGYLHMNHEWNSLGDNSLWSAYRNQFVFYAN